jgi:hypothetical protein
VSGLFITNNPIESGKPALAYLFDLSAEKTPTNVELIFYSQRLAH